MTNSYKRAAGIGSSNNGESNGKVTIHGGVFDVTGAQYGAGIGTGQCKDEETDNTAGKVIIYGGTVKAHGGDSGAGIGGGAGHNMSRNHGGELVIYDGEVTATGGEYAAGVGGGGAYGSFLSSNSSFYGGSGGNVDIYGGTVIAIAGNDCKARESDGGSAIGCGQGISGKEEKSKKLDIADNMMVTGGDSETNIERVFTSAERVPACRWRNYVRIEACTHTAKNGDVADVATTYTIDDEFYHTKHCRYCNVTIKEMHSGEDCVCGRKNQYEFTLYVPDTEKNSNKEGSSTTVGAGKNFYLPECSNVPAGYVFAGWEMNPDPEEPNGWADAWSH